MYDDILISMIYYAFILMLLSILIPVFTFNTSHGRQNISEEINYIFSDLTPNNLGVKEFGFTNQSSDLSIKNNILSNSNLVEDHKNNQSSRQ
jgi:hypothetical protein